MAWNEAVIIFFNFFEFCCYFFGIFYYASGRNGTEWQFLFSLFLSLFQPILAWNEVVMIFFNFFNFVAIFLEFSITRRVGTERNVTERQVLFSPFICLIQPILAWNKAIMVFFNFLNLFAIFFEFSITRRVGMKRNDNFYFLSFSAFPNQFWLEMTP